MSSVKASFALWEVKGVMMTLKLIRAKLDSFKSVPDFIFYLLHEETSAFTTSLELLRLNSELG